MRLQCVPRNTCSGAGVWPARTYEVQHKHLLVLAQRLDDGRQEEADNVAADAAGVAGRQRVRGVSACECRRSSLPIQRSLATASCDAGEGGGVKGCMRHRGMCECVCAYAWRTGERRNVCDMCKHTRRHHQVHSLVQLVERLAAQVGVRCLDLHLGLCCVALQAADDAAQQQRPCQ